MSVQLILHVAAMFEEELENSVFVYSVNLYICILTAEVILRQQMRLTLTRPLTPTLLS